MTKREIVTKIVVMRLQIQEQTGNHLAESVVEWACALADKIIAATPEDEDTDLPKGAPWPNNL